MVQYQSNILNRDITRAAQWWDGLTFDRGSGGVYIPDSRAKCPKSVESLLYRYENLNIIRWLAPFINSAGAGLGRAAPLINLSNIHIDNSDRRWQWGGDTTTTVHVEAAPADPSRSRRKKKKKEQDEGVQRIGIIALLGLGVALTLPVLCVGYAVKHYLEDRDFGNQLDDKLADLRSRNFQDDAIREELLRDMENCRDVVFARKRKDGAILSFGAVTAALVAGLFIDKWVGRNDAAYRVWSLATIVSVPTGVLAVWVGPSREQIEQVEEDRANHFDHRWQVSDEGAPSAPPPEYAEGGTYQHPSYGAPQQPYGQQQPPPSYGGYPAAYHGKGPPPAVVHPPE